MEISKIFLENLLDISNKDIILKLLQIKKEIDQLINLNIFEENLDIRHLVEMLQKVQNDFKDEIDHLRHSPKRWIKNLGRYLSSPILTSTYQNDFIVYIRCGDKRIAYINYLLSLQRLLERVFQKDFFYDYDYENTAFFL